MGFCYIWLYRRKKGAKDIFKKASSSNWLLLVQLLEDVMARRPASFDALCRRSTRFRRFVADVVVVDDVVVVGGGSKQVGVLSLFAFIVEKTWQKMPGTFRKKTLFSGRDSSMVLSVPTILWPRFRIPSTPSSLFSISIIEIVMKKGRK